MSPIAHSPLPWRILATQWLLVLSGLIWIGANFYRIGMAPEEAELSIRNELREEGRSFAKLEPDELREMREERTAGNRLGGGLFIVIGFLCFPLLLLRRRSALMFGLSTVVLFCSGVVYCYFIYPEFFQLSFREESIRPWTLAVVLLPVLIPLEAVRHALMSPRTGSSTRPDVATAN